MRANSSNDSSFDRIEVSRRSVRRAAPYVKNVLLSSLFAITFICHAIAQSYPITQAAPKIGAFGESWGNEKQGDLKAFSAWANKRMTSKNGSVSEGVILARQRRAALAELIKSDPAMAIASAVPGNIRKQLPDEVAKQLETRVSGVGDFLVYGAIAALGGPPVEATQRFVELNGHTYKANVYGRRAGETTKHGIPLHGIAIDDVLALHENALRELEPGELPDVTKTVLDLRAAEEKLTSTALPVLAEMGSKVYGFASAAKMQQAELRVQAAEAPINPNPAPAERLLEGSAQSQATPSAAAPATAFSTTGTKQVLIIRVDFSDLTGDPQGGQDTQKYVQNLADSQIAPYYLQSSYGKTVLVNTVTSKLYRMPKKAVTYATNGDGFGVATLVNDAKNAAGADYTIANYDKIIVLFSNLSGLAKSQVTYGGYSDQPGTIVRCNGEFDFRVIAHELGHTYGLFHANLWQVTDGNAISTSGTDQANIGGLGFTDNYGDPYDTMGANSANDQRTDFNPNKKNILGWVTDAQIQTITASGIYRINRFDNSTGTGILALKITKDGVHNYWVSIRRKFTDNASMQSGAYIVWAQNANNVTDLLDMNTPGTNVQDAALNVGEYFTDSAANIGIHPVDNGGTSPNEYMDVEVDIGNITSPIWVDFGFNGSPKNGTSANPYSTIADGVTHVSVGGTIFIKGPNSTPATITIDKPMTIQASGGPVTIGQ
jgi:hypothetical protein